MRNHPIIRSLTRRTTLPAAGRSTLAATGRPGRSTRLHSLAQGSTRWLNRLQGWNYWSAPRYFVIRWQFMRGADRLLRPFFEARDETAADTQLGKLLGEIADPIICRVVGAKFRVHLPLRQTAPRDANALDAEDTCSEAHGQLARRLHALRADLLARGPGQRQDASAPIEDFRAYAATVAFSAWNDYLRQKRPARARLLNQVRYLLEGNTRHGGLALWEIPASGERLCGFTAWKDRRQASDRVADLLSDPAEFVVDVVACGELRRINPAKLLAIIFDRLGGPIAIEDLLEAVAELWDIHDESAQETDFSDRSLPEEMESTHPTPYDEVRWMEYLGWLWRAVGGLSARQKAAFLLNSEVIKEFEYAGIASIRAVSGALGLNAEEVAAFWDDLPLSDNAIADRLSTSRQQVINLRKGARIILGRQLTLLLADFPVDGSPKPS